MTPLLRWEARGALALAGAFVLGAVLSGTAAEFIGPGAAAVLGLSGLLASAIFGWWLFSPLEDRLGQLVRRVSREAGQTEQVVGVDQLTALEHATSSLTAALSLANRQLRQQRALEGAILSSSLGGIVVTGRKGLVRELNPAVRELLPVVHDPLGKRPIEAIPFAPLSQALEQAVAEEREVELECTCGRFDLIVRAAPLADVGGAIAIIVDISSARRAERARSDFVANVSHELRTPITSIVGYAETLLADAETLDPVTREMLEPIFRNAQRLSNIFNDLLQLSRIEARQGDLPLELIELRELVDEVVGHSREAAAQKSITLTVDGAVEARGNREALSHILGNLVDNAVKYTQPEGEVRVLLKDEGDLALIEVIDNGPGIDPIHHARIFERFYRVDVGRSRAVGGTGLGLAIVKHLARATRATVTLRSMPGRGSNFTVRLPK